MKFFSKLVSAVAALSVVATMAVMPVAHAEGATLKLTATPAADKTYVDLTVSYSGAEAKMKNSGIKIDIGDDFAPAECPEDYEGSYWDAMLDDEMEGWSTDKKKLDGVTFAVQSGTIVFATATSKTTVAATLDASCDNLFTVRLYPVSGFDWSQGYTFGFTGQNTLGPNFKDYQNTLTLDADDAVIAAETSTTYAITAGENVTVKKGDEVVTEAAEGDVLTFVAADRSAENYDFVKFTVNDADATSPYTMGTEAITVAAVYNYNPPVLVPEATFETKEATANNAVGFAAILKAIANFDSVKEAGFVFANVDEVDKKMQTSQVKAADAVQIDEAFTYEFKGLDGFDQFGLKALPYVVTDKDEVVWGVFFGSLIDIVK